MRMTKSVVTVLALAVLFSGCVSLRRPVIIERGATEIYTGLGEPGMATPKSSLWMEGYLRNTSPLQETIYFPESFWILVNDSFFTAPLGDDVENCTQEQLRITGPGRPKCWRALGKDDFIVLEQGQYSKRLRSVGGPHLLRVAYANTGLTNVDSRLLVLTGVRPFYINLNFTQRDAPLRVSEQVLYFDWVKDVEYWP